MGSPRFFYFFFSLFFLLSRADALGEISRADRVRLETISALDPEFQEANGKLFDLLYQTNDWDAFFGRALFYRLSVERNIDFPLEPRLVALEALALARHCRWQEAKNVVAWGRARETQDQKIAFERILGQIELHESFHDSGKVENRAVSEPAGNWQLQKHQVSRLTNPRLMRVHVGSACQ